MRYLVLLLFVACCSAEKSESIHCVFECGTPACYPPVEKACSSAGYVVDGELPADDGHECDITYHCR